MEIAKGSLWAAVLQAVGGSSSTNGRPFKRFTATIWNLQSAKTQHPATQNELVPMGRCRAHERFSWHAPQPAFGASSRFWLFGIGLVVGGGAAMAGARPIQLLYADFVTGMLVPNRSSSMINSLPARGGPIGPISLALALLAFASTPSLSQSAAFAGLAGSWTGSGTISLSDGSRERLRCKATYQVSGGESRLRQSLRCASDSYRFDLSSDVVSENGKIAGSWSETSRGVSGSLNGRESAGTIVAAVDAPGFSANLSVVTRGNRQSFSISSQGDIRNVSVSMTR